MQELKETDQKEAKEPERPQVEEASSKAKKTPKGKRSSGKLKGMFSGKSTRTMFYVCFFTTISFCWFCFPAQGEEPEKTEPQIPSEKTETKEMTGKFHQEYAAALDHEGKQTQLIRFLISQCNKVHEGKHCLQFSFIS